jgi:tripartite ATP-independent transporter DctM subunit
MIAMMMFLTSLALLMFGFPVAFVFGSVAILFSFFVPEVGMGVLGLLPFRMYGIMGNVTLMSVPLFILMGLILEKSDIAKALLESMAKLFGPIRGGLAVSVIVVGAILAASTGIVGASVVMMSAIALPLMLKHNYSKSLSAGTIAAGGTLGQIIPPSIVLIVLADQMALSVGDLFKAALIPGLLLVGAYIVYILFYAWKNPSFAPAMENDEPYGEIVKQSLKAIVAPLALMIMILGSIFAGIASPTESAAVGVLGAFLLGVVQKKINVSALMDASKESVKLTGMIFMILFGATAFSLVFNELGGTQLITEFFKDDVGSVGFFIFIAMLAIFVLGFFIDFIEIAFIIVPILVPVVKTLGIDPLWFAVLIAMNLQASFLTPPFGFALFFLKGAAGDLVTTLQIYKGVVPFILIQLLVLVAVVIFPILALGLVR